MPTFEECLEPVLPSAHRIALNLTRNPDDADDLVQEAAVLAFRAFASFEPGTNFKAWFLRIQHNCFLNQLRRAGRRPLMVEVESDDNLESLYLYEQTCHAGWHQPFKGDPARVLLERLESAEILEALRALPDEYRDVALLYFLEDLSYEQIAAVVNCPLNTVRSRLHRARKLLQKSLWEIARDRGLQTPDSRSKSAGMAAGLSLLVWLLATLVGAGRA